MDLTMFSSRLVAFLSDLRTLLALAAAILLPLTFFSLTTPKRTTAGCLLPPGSSGLPIVGETLAFLASRKANKASEFVQIRAAKYGEVFRTSLFFQPTVVLQGAEANRFLFSNDGKLVKDSWPQSSLGLLGENTLVALSGVRHKHLRRVVMTCLYPEVLQKFVAKVDLLTQRHFTKHWLGRDNVVLYPLVKSHALDVASILLVGVEDSERREILATHFNTFVSGLMILPIYLPWTLYYKAHKARARLNMFLDEVISQRRMEMEAGQSTELVSTLITAKDENGKPLTQIEILDLILTVLFAGYDTNTSTISLVVKFLSENPPIYDEVLKEQTDIAESKKPGERLSWEDIQKMKYTWRVVQEILRLEPPIPGIFYVALRDFEYGGFKIPRGWKIYQSLSNSHSDERYFENPRTFDPSRFAGTGPAPYTFHPFGGGPHRCPGMDFSRMVMLVFFHHLVRRFKWTLVDPNEHITLAPLPLPVNGLPIILHEKKLPLELNIP